MAGTPRRRTPRPVAAVAVASARGPAPQTVEGLVANALATLRQELTVQAQQVASHMVVTIDGLEKPAAIEAFATYTLVAGIGQAVRVNLALATEMFGGGPQFLDALRRDVEQTIGASNAITNDFREDQRDPWITECLGHLLLNLSQHVPALGPPGTIPGSDSHPHRRA